MQRGEAPLVGEDRGCPTDDGLQHTNTYAHKAPDKGKKRMLQTILYGAVQSLAGEDRGRPNKRRTATHTEYWTVHYRIGPLFLGREDLTT